MKKIIAINGSPRRKNNTYDVIRACLDGCEEAGAETKLYQLADLKFSGCVSCFYCKNKAVPHGHCAVKDDISPILEEIKECDGLIMGAPIYFMNISSLMAAFLERLYFSNYIYNFDTPTVFPKALPSAFLYTMNLDERGMEHFHIESMLWPFQKFTRVILGKKPEILYACDTWQYPDYDKFESAMFDVERKKNSRANRWPRDLEKAREIGRRLAAGE